MDQTAVQDWLLTQAKEIAEALFKALLGHVGESTRQKLFGKHRHLESTRQTLRGAIHPIGPDDHHRTLRGWR